MVRRSEPPRRSSGYSASIDTEPRRSRDLIARIGRLDGRNYFTVRSDEVDATTWTNATDHGFILILNVAMGGGPTDATVSGVPMLIDYVRVYERGWTCAARTTY